jgi:type VI secretion system protein ImpA
MIAANIEALLAPVSPADPCGANLEYKDPAFAELERAAQGKPEQQIGSTVVPAEEPDWKAVQRQATELLARTKDLRVAVHLVRALVRTTGWAGLAQGLGVLEQLITQYWDGVHPRLDPDDANDPTMRVNILTSLSDPSMLSAVRAIPLVASRTLGRFSVKDLEIASGDAPGSSNGAEAPTMTTIEGAVMDTDLPTLEATTAAIHASSRALSALEEAVAARVSASSTPNFAALPSIVRKAETFLAAKLTQRSPGSVAALAAGDDASNGTAAGAVASSGSRTGEITSRDDVIRALDKISAYYTRNEPSSPIPLFMERCKRMVMMSFVDIVRELVPDALSQVEVLKGRTE